MVAYGAGHMCKPTPVHTSVRSDWALSNVLGQCCCLGAVLLRWGLSCCTQSVPPRPPHCVQYCALCLQCYLPLQLCLHAGQTPLPHSRGKCSRDTGRQARITASQYDSPNQYICALTHCSMEAQTSPVTAEAIPAAEMLRSVSWAAVQPVAVPLPHSLPIAGSGRFPDFRGCHFSIRSRQQHSIPQSCVSSVARTQ